MEWEAAQRSSVLASLDEKLVDTNQSGAMLVDGPLGMPEALAKLPFESL